MLTTFRLMLPSAGIVTYWPSTEPSIKRCTCVNKQNSGSRWMLDNYITRCPRRFEPVGVSWRQDAELRPAADRGPCGPQWPPVEQPSQDEEKVLVWSEELWVNITVCPRFQLISHTQPTLTLSRIKCERYIFIKKCVRSIIEVRILCLIMFLHIFVYVCGYTTVFHVEIGSPYRTLNRTFYLI